MSLVIAYVSVACWKWAPILQVRIYSMSQKQIPNACPTLMQNLAKLTFLTQLYVVIKYLYEIANCKWTLLRTRILVIRVGIS